jgi:hypothetical protein
MTGMVELRAAALYGKWMQATACFSGSEPIGQRYFLNVLAVTATLNAKTVAKGNTTKLGCRLNGSAR